MLQPATEQLNIVLFPLVKLGLQHAGWLTTVTMQTAGMFRSRWAKKLWLISEAASKVLRMQFCSSV